MFTMKMHLALTFVVCLCSLSWAQKYHTLDDDYDEDAALKNSETIKKQLKCFLEQGPCTEVQQSYKDYITEAVQRSCDKCMPHQEHEFKVFLAEAKRSAPELYRQFLAKYDPQGAYLPKLQAELAKY